MNILAAQNFYLIRHGETELNALQLCCGGGVDTDLNDTGRKQADMARQVLENAQERPTLIIHSGMNRTRDTAAILNSHLNLPVITDAALREHMVGEWERKPWAEALPHILNNERPAGGENLDEFAARVGSALNRNLYEYQDERILFVGHGGTFHSILRLYKQMKNVLIPNATLHGFTPAPEVTHMPWQIDLYDMMEGGVRQSAASICPARNQAA